MNYLTVANGFFCQLFLVATFTGLKTGTGYNFQVFLYIAKLLSVISSYIRNAISTIYSISVTCVVFIITFLHRGSWSHWYYW